LPTPRDNAAKFKRQTTSATIGAKSYGAHTALAAKRLGINEETIKDWAQRGLLSNLRFSDSSEGVSSLVTVQQLVDEDELVEVAESLGWLQLSAEG